MASAIGSPTPPPMSVDPLTIRPPRVANPVVNQPAVSDPFSEMARIQQGLFPNGVSQSVVGGQTGGQGGKNPSAVMPPTTPGWSMGGNNGLVLRPGQVPFYQPAQTLGQVLSGNYGYQQPQLPGMNGGKNANMMPGSTPQFGGMGGGLSMMSNFGMPIGGASYGNFPVVDQLGGVNPGLPSIPSQQVPQYNGPNFGAGVQSYGNGPSSNYGWGNFGSPVGGGSGGMGGPGYSGASTYGVAAPRGGTPAGPITSSPTGNSNKNSGSAGGGSWYQSPLVNTGARIAGGFIGGPIGSLAGQMITDPEGGNFGERLQHANPFRNLFNKNSEAAPTGNP